MDETLLARLKEGVDHNEIVKFVEKSMQSPSITMENWWVM